MILDVLNTMIPAAAIALAAWAAVRLLGVNAATRYWVWWGVLAMVVLLLMPSGEVTPGAGGAPVTLPVAPDGAAGFDWALWMVALWVAVALYRVVRMGWSYSQLRSLQGSATEAPRELQARFEHWRSVSGVRRAVRLLVSGEVAMPMAAGYRPAAVIVPQGLLTQLTPQEMDHVLLHELAHVARRDDWSNLAARALGVVFGLHPVAAFALARIEREREMACDDWVVVATGEARTYAESLTRLFEMARDRRQPVLASGVMGSRLGDRVERLLMRERSFERGASLLQLTAIMAVILGVGFVGLHLPGWVAYAQAPVAPPKPAETQVPAPVAADAQMQRMEALLSRLETMMERLTRVSPERDGTIGKLIRAESIYLAEDQLKAAKVQIEHAVSQQAALEAQFKQAEAELQAARREMELNLARLADAVRAAELAKQEGSTRR
jgi:beta-lactamase regulating signal transducer with metallopeptidase domain